MCLQHVGTPPPYTWCVREYLPKYFPKCWLVLDGPHARAYTTRYLSLVLHLYVHVKQSLIKEQHCFVIFFQQHSTL